MPNIGNTTVLESNDLLESGYVEVLLKIVEK